MAMTTAVAGERIDYASTLSTRAKLTILAGVLLALFLAALDQTIVSTALPAIIRNFHGIDLVAWVSTGYLLASTTMVPVYGKLSDIYGRRVILIWGIGTFLFGSALCGIAGSMIQLILFRVVQGIGAAALTSTAFAVPADLFAPAERARYMGLIGGVFGLSSIIGPFVGGFLTDQLSWRWVFYVNLPLGLLALAFILRKMPPLTSGLRAPIDWKGALLLVFAVVPLLLGLTLDKSLYPWNSPLIIGLLATAAVATIVFLLVEARVPSPIIAFNLFQNRTFTVAIIASMLNGAAFFSSILFVSLFLVNVVGLSATEAGTAQMPLMVAFVTGSVLSTQLVARIQRYKLLILMGFSIVLIGFFSLSQLTVESTAWDVSWRLAVLGLGLGPALPLLNLAMQNAVSFQYIGTATANRQFFQQLGQATGAALFGVVLVTTLTGQLSGSLAPLIDRLPPVARETVNLAELRSGSTGEEGAQGQANIGVGITTAVQAQFARQRQLLATARANHDPQALATLLADPELPSAVREELQAPSQPNFDAALLQLAHAEEAAVQQASALQQELAGIVRQAFADSITRIYTYSIWLVVTALALVALWLPEVPLRTSNRAEHVPPAME